MVVVHRGKDVAISLRFGRIGKCSSGGHGVDGPGRALGRRGRIKQPPRAVTPVASHASGRWHAECYADCSRVLAIAQAATAR
ncbi:hypothetical protein GW17_00059746 [Ensete ventricosum]|nr:hypothetical protein GW17_00059746 [Ensete ventricosum]